MAVASIRNSVGPVQVIAPRAALIANGNGNPNGVDIAGAVAATTAGALRYTKRPAAPAYTLSYPPPVLVNPVIVTLGASTSLNTAATGSPTTGLDNTRDYLILLPVGRTRTLEINGGRNVIALGLSSALGVQTDAALIITDNSTNGAAKPQEGRIVHIEGALIQNPHELQFDGFDYDCPSAIVQFVNIRCLNLEGGNHTTEEYEREGVKYKYAHADISQNQGGAQQVRYDHISGTCDYQGITAFPHDGSVPGGLVISNVDLGYQHENPRPASNTGYLLFTQETAHASEHTPVSIVGSFVITNNKAGQTVRANSVWSSPDVSAPTEDGSGNISFNPATGITGKVIDGNVNPSAVPAGGFCPEGNCGLGYVSPGYGTPKQPGAQAMFIEEGTTNVITNPTPASLTGYTTHESGVTLTEGTDANGARLHAVCDGTVKQQGLEESPAKTHAATQGETWTASCYVDGEATPLVIEIVERNSAGTFLKAATTTVNPGSAPARSALTYTTTEPTCAFIQIRVRVTGEEPLATTFNVRKLQLELVGHATSYCDGAQEDCSWSGTANASTSVRPTTRVQLPVASHLAAGLGALAMWVNIPTLVPLTYLWSVGTPATAGQDFLGVRVNSTATSLELVAQTGTGAVATLAIGAIATNTWTQVNATWNGTYLAGSTNEAPLSVGLRSTPANSLNTPIEIGGLTNNTAKADGYFAPMATFSIALTRSQFTRAYAVPGAWELGLLA